MLSQGRALELARARQNSNHETEYWLLVDSGCVPSSPMADLLDETRQLIAIFTRIDKSAKG
jgi:hypothetical protein